MPCVHNFNSPGCVTLLPARHNSLLAEDICTGFVLQDFWFRYWDSFQVQNHYWRITECYLPPVVHADYSTNLAKKKINKWIKNTQGIQSILILSLKWHHRWFDHALHSMPLVRKYFNDVHVWNWISFLCSHYERFVNAFCLELDVLAFFRILIKYLPLSVTKNWFNTNTAADLMVIKRKVWERALSNSNERR